MLLKTPLDKSSLVKRKKRRKKEKLKKEYSYPHETITPS